jgi:hypothetical protein
MSAQTRTIRETCELIKADVAGDVLRFEGATFDGPTVSVWMGNLSAAVSALAGMIAVLDERIATDIDEAIDAHRENSPHVYADGSTY